MRRLCPFMVAVAACTIASVAMAAPTTPKWSLIPEPAVVHPAGHGVVTVSNGDQVAVQAHGTAQATAIAHRFAALVASTRDLHLDVTGMSGNQANARIVFDLDPASRIKNKAGYRIDIGNGRIRVTARTPRGLFYGSVTTWQLLTSNPVAHGPAHVADGTIADHPRFHWRGLMLDSVRHFQSVADIKKLIDWMSLHKLDVLHWHLTGDQGWRLQIPQYPKLTSIGGCRKAVGAAEIVQAGGPDQPYCGYYTDAQVRQLVKYAAARFITIVPEIEEPGHSQAAIASYPDLGVTGKRPPVATQWGISDFLDAPDRHTITFMENVLDEVMKLFPSTYIHLGGDEAPKVQWKASPKVRAHLARLGLKNMDALQEWMFGKLGSYLVAHGRIPIGWDEILEGGNLPKSAVVMSWHGVSGGVKAANMGHDAILTPDPALYLDHVQSRLHDEAPGELPYTTLKDVYTFNPLPASVNAAQARHILGIQANLWTEYKPTFASDVHAIFPRISALSEVAWSPASAIHWTGFLQRLPAQVARDKALGIAYADSAWQPNFHVSADHGKLRVALSNQVDHGIIRYTTNGNTPTTHSARYTHPLTLPAGHTTTLRAATFATDGLRLAAPRTWQVNAESLLTRNSDQLHTCPGPNGLVRMPDDRPLHGSRPVYKVNIDNTCWLWKNAPLDGVRNVTLRVGNLPWNYFPEDAARVLSRPEVTPDGEIDVHLDSCKGPRIARLPLAKAAQTRLTTTLHAKLPALTGVHTLCFIATGNPGKGRIWAIDTVKLSPATWFVP